MFKLVIIIGLLVLQESNGSPVNDEISINLVNKFEEPVFTAETISKRDTVALASDQLQDFPDEKVANYFLILISLFPFRFKYFHNGNLSYLGYQH